MHLLYEKHQDSLQNWLKSLKEFQLDSIFETSILGRAYLYKDSVKIINQEENSIEFKVGTSRNYIVNLSLRNGSIYGNCSCPYEGKCKHVAACVLVMVKPL